MSRPTGIPLADAATHPDQIDPAALRELIPLFAERVERCWRTTVGFLVMTNLRCVHLWHKPELLRHSEWHVGPTFFFYGLAPPRVIGGRFLELTDVEGDHAESSRFLVHDAETIAREIEAARPAGRSEWEARRSRITGDLGRLWNPPLAPGTRVVVHEVVKVRCPYCGNLIEVTRKLCPFCGAPQP
jgi:hypothetical protein